MSDEHKAALAQGREASRAVRAYLEALQELNKPKKRGRRRSLEDLQARLKTIEQTWGDADALEQLQMAAEQIEIEKEIEEREQEAQPVDLTDLETAFAQHAKIYAESKQIPYAAWRTMGVTPKVLRAAGIPRSGTGIGTAMVRFGVGSSR